MFALRNQAMRSAVLFERPFFADILFCRPAGLSWSRVERLTSVSHQISTSHAARRRGASSGMSAAKYNQRNPAVKRIVQELKEIQRDDNPDILAEVLEVSQGLAVQAGTRKNLRPGVHPHAARRAAGQPVRVALCHPGGVGHGI
jgi:hypothetical protein